jgi:hypothetical protein
LGSGAGLLQLLLSRGFWLMSSALMAEWWMAERLCKWDEISMEREISKAEFKELYLKYGKSCGWTLEYWNEFYENEIGKRYFFREPESADKNRMFIVSDAETRRVILMSEESEERFFRDPR